MKKVLFIGFLLMSFFMINTFKMKTFDVPLTNVSQTSQNKYHEYAKPESIISAKSLKNLIENENIKLIALKDGVDYTEYIPSSQIVYIDEVSQMKNGIKGFVASKAQMEQLMSRIGVSNEDTIVLYDNFNNVLATRLWFILNLYGHQDVLVLDGGINAWINEDYYVVRKIEEPEKTNYKAHNAKKDRIIENDEIKERLNDETTLFLDVRTPEEYKKGHIPRAVNIPFSESLVQGKFKSFDELKMLYVSKGISPNEKSIIVYCTHGNRASYTYFVLTQLLGYQNVLLYDGSFAEYSASNLPIKK